MTEKQRKFKYWVFKLLSIIISCGMPIMAVCEHFPLWATVYGTARTIGAGSIICLIILAIIFKNSVFNFVRDKLKLKHAPKLSIWIVMLIIAYIVLFINSFVQDLITVFWMGLVGCAIGTVLTYIAENWYGEKKEDTNGGA